MTENSALGSFEASRLCLVRDGLLSFWVQTPLNSFSARCRSRDSSAVSASEIPRATPLPHPHPTFPSTVQCRTLFFIYFFSKHKGFIYEIIKFHPRVPLVQNCRREATPFLTRGIVFLGALCVVCGSGYNKVYTSVCAACVRGLLDLGT